MPTPRRMLAPRLLRTPQVRTYFSHETPRPAPYPPLETTILRSALSHVPTHGFTPTALRLGAQNASYLSATTNLFPRGVYELITYHLVTQRLGLADRLDPSLTDLPLGLRVRRLVLQRLQGNIETGTVRHWHTALGHMSLAENLGASVAELGRLSDEIWFLAGDTSVDGSWYTKRASLGAVYAAVETFQSQDTSTEYRDTEAFLDRRLDEVRTLGSAWRNLGQWAGFQGVAAVNLARSLGVRI